MPTVGDFAQEMAEEFGDDYSNDADISTQYLRWVQEVINDLWTAGRFVQQNGSQTVATVSSTRTYALNAEASEVTSVFLVSPAKLLGYSTPEEIASYGYDTNTTATPQHWYYEKADTDLDLIVGLWPVPNLVTNVLFRYMKHPPTVAVSDQMPFPAEYTQVARDGVRALIRHNDGNPQAGSLHDAAYQAGKDLLNARFGSRTKPPSRLPANNLAQTHQAPGASGG